MDQNLKDYLTIVKAGLPAYDPHARRHMNNLLKVVEKQEKLIEAQEERLENAAVIIVRQNRVIRSLKKTLFEAAKKLRKVK